MPLLPFWLVLPCFFSHCELAVGFFGFELIKSILPGLVLLCFAACASCYTRSPSSQLAACPPSSQTGTVPWHRESCHGIHLALPSPWSAARAGFTGEIRSEC